MSLSHSRSSINVPDCMDVIRTVRHSQAGPSGVGNRNGRGHAGDGHMTTGVVGGLFDVYVGIVPHRERTNAVPDLVTIAPACGRSEGFPGDDGAIAWDVKVGLVERVAVAFVECDPPWPATRCRFPFHEVPVSSDYMYR